jgi:glycosyltransferase involved in cell wall biosynthesis
VARSIFFYADSREVGGAERALLMLLRNLDRSAWEPSLLLDEGAAGRLEELAAETGVETRRVPAMPLGLEGARRAPGLAKRIRRSAPDLLHVSMSSPMSAKWGLAAGVLARVPTIGTVQLVPSYEPSRSARLQLRAIAARVDRFIAVSRDIAAELSERFRWPRDRIEVIHNAVSPERFVSAAPPGLREQLAGGREAPVVLTVARLTEQKGLSVLLQAASRVPGAVFVVAGDGPLRASLEREAAAAGVANRVSFLGDRSDVPDLLAACDVFALPSLYEGSSLAVLEAMAAGRATVSSSIGGTAELIDDGVSGLLTPPGDPESLAAALRRVLVDDGLRAALAARGRQRVEEDFTEQAMARKVELVYEELLGDGRPAGR